LIVTRKAISVGYAASAAVVVGSLAFGRRGSTTRRLGVGVGIAGMLATWAAWYQADKLDREITRNPEVMNGHFITGGAASAMVGGLADVEQLRRVMLVPAEARVLERRKDRRGHRLR
jgi:hypothetical protein